MGACFFWGWRGIGDWYHCSLLLYAAAPVHGATPSGLPKCPSCRTSVVLIDTKYFLRTAQAGAKSSVTGTQWVNRAHLTFFSDALRNARLWCTSSGVDTILPAATPCTYSSISIDSVATLPTTCLLLLYCEYDTTAVPGYQICYFVEKKDSHPNQRTSDSPDCKISQDRERRSSPVLQQTK